MVNYILDLLFPRKCLCCSKKIDKNNICVDCTKEFEYNYIVQEILNNNNSTEVLSLFKYKKSIINGIYNFKFYNRPETLKIWGNYLFVYLEKYIKKHEINLIISVPMHRNKENIRGYNQSEILAKRLARLSKIPYDDILIKNKDHIQLHYLEIEKRSQIIKNSFSLKKSKNIIGKNILLVDDVFTTGATIKGCSDILYNENVKSIIGATLATAYTVENI